MTDSMKAQVDFVNDKLDFLKRELAVTTEADKCLALREEIDLLKLQLIDVLAATPGNRN